MPDFEPTPEQQAILGHDPTKHARVLAGPGTGKSATLVALIDLLLERVDAPRIRLLTFTRAATAELAKKVSASPAAAAERPSTIHSFAISALLRNPGAGDFPKPLRIADDWERKTIIQRTLSRILGVRSEQLRDLTSEMAADWQALAPEVDPQFDAQLRNRFLGAWREHREIYGYTLLAELPYALLHALENHPDLQGLAYDLIVVDEYQDLNACDLAVIKKISERGSVVIGAGDDDQSIYKFRKAAPEGIRRFLTDYPGASDYPLSVTQRCGSRIVAWASYVIEGDPRRAINKPPLRAAESSPPGETALLSFAGHVAEPRGIASLVRKLIDEEDVPATEILILLRSDHQGLFSRAIKQELTRLGVAWSDPDAVERLLAEPGNRWVLAAFRLLVHQWDSLAWATLLKLKRGIADSFAEHIYERARAARTTFAAALFEANNDDFAGAPSGSARVARQLMDEMTLWIAAHPLPEEIPSGEWGAWVLENCDEAVPSPGDELATLLRRLDEKTEEDATLGRYLGQAGPLGEDIASAEAEGVRIMTMATAKGLTVDATIVAACEEGLIPRRRAELAEERRLLYVAMTRARRFLYLTWALRRTGPTARAGEPQVRDARSYCSFLRGGPVRSEDGLSYMRTRWPSGVRSGRL